MIFIRNFINKKEMSKKTAKRHKNTQNGKFGSRRHNKSLSDIVIYKTIHEKVLTLQVFIFIIISD